MESILKQKSIDIARRIDRVEPPKMKLEFKEKFNPSLSDWTVNTGSASLDSSIKYSGNSSCKLSGNLGANISRNNFSVHQLKMIGWLRDKFSGAFTDIHIQHPGYGDIYLVPSLPAIDTWYKYRFTYWYDSPNDTQWGRIERYSAGSWVQEGADDNKGSGSPSSGTIKLCKQSGSESCWFDDVEVYSKSL
jgi:hypothetical protein